MAVAGFVSFFVLAAFNRVTFRPWTHVRQKVPEAVASSPTLTHGYAPGTVVAVLNMLRIRTTLPDRFPNDVLFSSAFSVSLVSLRQVFAVCTAARSRSAIYDMSGVLDSLSTAFTAKVPEMQRTSFFCVT